MWRGGLERGYLQAPGPSPDCSMANKMPVWRSAVPQLGRQKGLCKGCFLLRLGLKEAKGAYGVELAVKAATIILS